MPRIKLVKIPQCRCDAFLQPCFSAENLQLDCHFPVDEAAPSWYFPGWQKQRILHAQEEGPSHPPGPREHSYKMPWPFPSLALLLRHDWVDRGSIQDQPLDATTGTWKKFLLLELEFEVWEKALKNGAGIEILLLRIDALLKLIFEKTKYNHICKNYLHTFSF